MKPHLTDDPWLMYGKRFSMILEKEEKKKMGIMIQQEGPRTHGNI